jgi:hypothetical protein
MIVTISHNEIKKGAKGDYLYIKYITSKGRESGKAVFGELRNKWGLCQNGARLELKLDGAPNYNVLDILKVEPEDETEVEEIPFEESSGGIPPEPKPKGKKPEAYARLADSRDYTPSGQEIGRCWNAIDALYIGGKLATLFGKENAEAILKHYRGVLASTLKLPVDGAKLPMWDKKES